LQEQRAAVDALCDQISVFVTRINAERLPDELKNNTPRALRVVGYLEEVVGLLDDFVMAGNDLRVISTPEVSAQISVYLRDVVKHVSRCDPATEDVAEDRMQAHYLELRDRWRHLKASLLEAATRGEIPVHSLNFALEGLRALLRIAEQSTKAADRLDELLHAGSQFEARNSS
jgi:hypothetical protein